MKHISLDDYLNKDNAWTNRLIGNEPVLPKNRTIDQIEIEYNQEVYRKRLELALQDVEGYRKRSLHYISTGDSYVSIKDSIYLMPSSMFNALKRVRILEQIEKYCKDESICELGAGNGQNLGWLEEYQQRSVYGGEYSENAVKLARMLGFEVEHFNYYQPNDYRLIRDNSTILTVHSIEQIPDATAIIDSLRKVRHKIKYVMHFEPVYDAQRTSLIGLLRNKYTQINDYNKNLLELLNESSDIEILHTDIDAFGNNPLNPTSIIVWKFI